MLGNKSSKSKLNVWTSSNQIIFPIWGKIILFNLNSNIINHKDGTEINFSIHILSANKHERKVELNQL